MREEVSRAARLGGIAVFAFGLSVSAFGQMPPTTPPAQPLAQTGPVERLSIEDAVKMALENNLSVQVEKFNPAIQDVGITLARSAWAPILNGTVTSTNQNSPISSFFAGATDKLTRDSVQANVGTSGLLPWGSNYSVKWDSTRAKSNSVYDSPNPSLSSNLNFDFIQPLLRNFKIDGARQQLIISRKSRELSDISLQQTILTTIRTVKNAYMDLKYAKSALEVAQQSLDLARESLRNNRSRVEIGTMAPIDIVEAQAEVARREEAVIVASATVDRTADRLRTLIFEPQRPDFWQIQFDLTTPAMFEPRPVDVDGAVRTALDKRTDLRNARKQLEMTDVNVQYYRNQTLPDLNAEVAYGLSGQGGTSKNFGSGFPPPVLSQVTDGFGSVVSKMLSGAFPAWTFGVTVSYPLGTSSAEANMARARLQLAQGQVSLRNLELQITTSVRDVARQVQTNQKRVEATTATRKLMEQRLVAEQKKFAAGMSTNFLVFQAQRDLADAQNNELSAILDYNRSLVDFETVQEAPTAGGSTVVLPSVGTTGGGA